MGIVVLYHAQIGLPGGFVGVDIFFVISGFLITRIISRDLHDGRFSIARFYRARIRRIFPALFACLAATAMAGIVVLLPSELAQLGSSIAATAGFVSNLLFWDQTNYFDTGAWEQPLLHTWSLAVEEQFYLAWPVLLLLVARVRRLHILPALIAGGIVVSLIGAEWMASYSPRTAFYMAPMRAWELLSGALLAVAPRLRFKPQHCGAAVLGGLALILLAALTYSDRMRFPGLSALPPCLGAALIIAADAPRGQVNRVLGSRPMVAIGFISYSLYLWHWPILVLARVELARPMTMPETLGCVGAAIVLATLSWRFVEQPFHRFGRGPGATEHQAQSPRPTLIAGAVTLAIAIAVGAWLSWSGGLPGRVTPAVRAMDSFHERFAFEQIDCFVDDSLPGDVERCLFGKTAPTDPTTLVWGDSHAMHHVRSFRAAFAHRDERLVIAVATGCLPLPGALPTLGLGRADQRCSTFNARMLDIVEHRPAIRRIVLIGRWTNLVLPRVGADGRHPTSRYLIDDTTTSRTAEATADVFARALDRLLVALDRRDIAVILLNEGPEYAASVPHCLARAAWRHRDMGRCGRARSAILRDRQPVDAIITRLMARHPRVTLYDTLPPLCPGTICRPMSRAGLVTLDAHHLTALGSRIALSGLHLPPEKRRTDNTR